MKIEFLRPHKRIPETDRCYYTIMILRFGYITRLNSQPNRKGITVTA